jgi:hypothetical protein
LRTVALLGKSTIKNAAVVSYRVLLLFFTIGCATIYIWLKAITLLCQATFIAGSIWLCIGIAILNFFFGQGDSFSPLYVTIIGAAVIGQAWKYSRIRAH